STSSEKAGSRASAPCMLWTRRLVPGAVAIAAGSAPLGRRVGVDAVAALVRVRSRLARPSPATGLSHRMVSRRPSKAEFRPPPPANTAAAADGVGAVLATAPRLLV